MNLLRQMVMFGAVGLVATLTHVGVAWPLMELGSINQYLANLIGAVCAFAVSFLGNAILTFSVRNRLGFYLPRYALVSGFSLILTTLELAATDRLGMPRYAYVLVVLVTVPPATFLLAKIWAFTALKREPR